MDDETVRSRDAVGKGIHVGSYRDTLAYLNDQLKSEFPDQYVAGWRVTTSTYFPDVEESHQIQVSTGGGNAEGVARTAAGPSLDLVLEVAMVMARDGTRSAG